MRFRSSSAGSATANARLGIGVQPGPAPPAMSPELLDDLDEFVGFVAVAAGVVEEFFGVFDDGALFGGAGDGDAVAASEFEEAFVAELAEGAEDGVGVDVEDGGEVFGGWESFAGFGFAVGDGAIAPSPSAPRARAAHDRLARGLGGRPRGPWSTTWRASTSTTASWRAASPRSACGSRSTLGDDHVGCGGSQYPAPARRDAAPARRPASRPPGRRLVVAARRGRARARLRRCLRAPAHPEGRGHARCAAGAARWPIAACASSSATSRSSGWRYWGSACTPHWHRRARPARDHLGRDDVPA